MVAGVQEYLAETKGWGLGSLLCRFSKALQPFVFRTRYGLLRVSGIGSDTVSEDCALLIDLGGNDVYRNNAGGCRTAEAGIALCIDHWGNDQYVSDRPYVQGFDSWVSGCWWIWPGMTVTLPGTFAQGAGIMGVGALWDLGGDDTYDGHAFVQGAGMFGLGMLLDDEGDDQYDGATLCQGAATTLGLGVLDLGRQRPLRAGGEAGPGCAGPAAGLRPGRRACRFDPIPGKGS